MTSPSPPSPQPISDVGQDRVNFVFIKTTTYIYLSLVAVQPKLVGKHLLLLIQFGNNCKKSSFPTLVSMLGKIKYNFV